MHVKLLSDDVTNLEHGVSDLVSVDIFIRVLLLSLCELFFFVSHVRIHLLYSPEPIQVPALSPGRAIRCHWASCSLQRDTCKVICTVKKCLWVAAADVDNHIIGLLVPVVLLWCLDSRPALANAVSVPEVHHDLLIRRLHSGVLLALSHCLHLALLMLDLLRDLRKLITKLMISDLEAACVGSRDWNGSLEMRLLMNTLHHRPRLEEVVGALKLWLAACGWLLCRITLRQRLTHLHWLPYSAHYWVLLMYAFAWKVKLTCSIIFADLFLKIVLVNLISCETSLGWVLESLHKPLSLKVWVEAHRRSYLFSFLTRPHLPHSPLWLGRRTINIAIALEGRLNALIVRPHRAKAHSWRSNHLPGVLLLRKTLSIVVWLSDRFHSHLLAITCFGYSSFVVVYSTIYLRLGWRRQLGPCNYSRGAHERSSSLNSQQSSSWLWLGPG